ncbi:MAG: hypothetical protein DWQ08_07880 [Proteobacteria bacterium]|nr:MAG: hypothetical protein DWQ08_07880 [Pseudomonadota bacterium]
MALLNRSSKVSAAALLLMAVSIEVCSSRRAALDSGQGPTGGGHGFGIASRDGPQEILGFKRWLDEIVRAPRGVVEHVAQSPPPGHRALRILGAVIGMNPGANQ